VRESDVRWPFRAEQSGSGEKHRGQENVAKHEYRWIVKKAD